MESTAKQEGNEVFANPFGAYVPSVRKQAPPSWIGHPPEDETNSEENSRGLDEEGPVTHAKGPRPN